MGSNVVEECCQQINHVIGYTCDCLYNRIDNFLFQKIDCSLLYSMIPKWVVDCGINPEDSSTKDLYDKFRNHAKHPIFGLFLYKYDMWSKVAAIQDRLQAVNFFYDNSTMSCHLKQNTRNISTQRLAEVVVDARWKPMLF